MRSLNLSLDVPCFKHDMWTYLVLYYESIGLTHVAKMRFWSICAYMFDKWKYWNDFVSKVFGFVFSKMKVLKWLCRENEILVYLPTTLINEKFELVPWSETWYVKLFGFVFGKMKVLECPLSRKRDFSLYGYNFDKYEGWTCRLI